MDKISICIPTYNGERYLEETLNSVLNQSYNNFEIIIVDDQSSDKTAEISKKYSNKNNRIKFYQNKTNLGLVNNWNRCIDLATGQWIKFVFQDDLLHPKCLETFFNCIDHSHPFIFCHRDVSYDPLNKSSTKLAKEILDLPILNKLVPEGGFISPQKLCQITLTYPDINFFGEPTASLIRRDLFLKYGKFNDRLVQLCDLEFWLRIGVNEGVYFLPETLATFRVHENSTTSKNLVNKIFSMEYLDRLKLRYQLAFGKHFSNLRYQARDHKPPLCLKNEFNKVFVQADWFAANAAHSGSDPSRQLIKELNLFISSHPYIYSSYHFWIHKLYKWIQNNLLWRFKK